MSPTDLASDICYRAILARDARFDGRFYTAVVSTGIYCRPVCPARAPKRENCLFLPSAAAAERFGFRACLRCRPEAAPGSPARAGTAATVTRALGAIAEGGHEESVARLAARLGIGERHLRRLFTEHLGTSPVSLAAAQRALFARKLLAETRLPVTEIVHASGFRSVRRFNTVMRETFGAAPRELRKREGAEVPSGEGLVLKLAVRPPFDWERLLAFLATRAVPGIEAATGTSYARTFRVGEARGLVEARLSSARTHVVAAIRIDRVRALPLLVAGLRRLFDLDADSTAIDAALARDPVLAPLVARRPGLRVPGTLDPFEIAVRAILGQLVSVKAARTLAARLVATHGEPFGTFSGGDPARLFPRPDALAGADLTAIGLTRARARGISALAEALVAEPELLAPHGEPRDTLERLAAIEGIGPWTAHYIAMRALRDPDAFPASDLGLARSLAAHRRRPGQRDVLARAEAWRPWRAYAAQHLWTADAEDRKKGEAA
ncbi:MAG: DNA-3-methyladenine glycosylase 2 family protein [Alphaproteobacteria bacterium]|nr:DNA-3-methyladenine glycosylase 2 family protein [Alphaproteobacteria bacterium]